MIATIDDSGFYNGGVPWFPGSRQRFQLAGSGEGTLIVGSTTFVRDHDFGGPTGVVTEYLSRGRYWHRVSGGWVETPLMDEGEESERLASVACDVNADGVIVGAVSEPVFGSPSETWRYRPAYWLPGGAGHSLHLFDQPQQPCLFQVILGGIAYGVGPGEAPLVAGAAFTLCGSGQPQAFGASLAGAPASAPMVPLHDGLFACAEEEPEDLVLSEALAVLVDADADRLAVGFDFSYDPQTFQEPAAPCIVPISYCDLSSQVGVRALTWWLPEPPVASNPGPVIAEGIDWRFRAFDGAAGPAADERPAWSIAGGHSLDETIAGTCHLHATAFMGYLPGTEEYGTNSGQGLAFDVHAAIVDAADPPGGTLEDRIASAIGAICHADAGSSAATDVEYLAAGARFGSNNNDPYGVIWIGKRDGEGGWAWCGRRVSDDAVAWRPSRNLEIHAVHDILSTGVAVGHASENNVKKLVLLTSLCDLTGDFRVNGADMGMLLADWGAGPGGGVYLPGDLNRDDLVNGGDLGILLAAWNADSAPINMDCDAKLWLPISPIAIAATATLLGFDGLDGLGTHCTTLPAEHATALGQYISTLAPILNQEG